MSNSRTQILEEIKETEIQLEMLMKRLNELNLKEQREDKQKKLITPNNITLFVEISKEEIIKQKTAKQLETEKNSTLFLRNKIPDNKKYYPYNTGSDIKEKRYIDMFNHILVNRDGKKEGKVKFINECFDFNKLKNSKLKDEIDSKHLQLNNQNRDNTFFKDKIYIALQKKKINDLKISARDLKIKGYSLMQKEDLVTKIYEIIKKKSTTIDEKNKKETIETKKLTKSELLKSCDIDDTIDYDEDDINEETFDDPSENIESEEVDYN